MVRVRKANESGGFDAGMWLGLAELGAIAMGTALRWGLRPIGSTPCRPSLFPGETVLWQHPRLTYPVSP